MFVSRSPLRPLLTLAFGLVAAACGGSPSDPTDPEGPSPRPDASVPEGPRFLSSPPARALIGALYAYDVMAEGTELRLELTQGPAAARVPAGRLRLEWTPTPDDAGTHAFTLALQDGAGLEVEQHFEVEVERERPEPDGTPPALDPTRPLDFEDAYSFLYQGENARQQGVLPGAISGERLSLLHGVVTDREGTSLAAVRVSIKSRPELGHTYTDADGRFAFAVNGGGTSIVRFEKPGFLWSERSVRTRWHEHGFELRVALVPLSETVTEIQLGSAELQVARGPLEADEDGERQATLLIPPGTQAELTTADGQRLPLTKLSLRATEYTVGPRGAKAMPSPLPATSGYTYAVEVSADEAQAMGATSVSFSQPVPFYVENFLGFPVGEKVPVGYYDFEDSKWKAERDGLVIAVLSHDAGRAVLDLDGDEAPDDSDALDAHGFTTGELERLAALYAPGTTLWRVRLPHLTPWDCNWPFGPPPDARPPPPGLPQPGPPEREPEEDDPCEKEGSIIECDDGGLGQAIDLPGTGYTLHYRSRRMPGWKASRSVRIPILGPEVPPNVAKVVVELEIAGRSFREELEPAPNLSHNFEWDGRDVFGREVYGELELVGRVGNAYRPVFYRGSSLSPASFGMSSGSITMEGATRASVDVSDARAIMWRPLPKIVLKASRPMVGDLGGFSLDVHHRLTERGLELGDGRARKPWLYGGVELAAGSLETGSAAAFEYGVRHAGITPDGDLYAFVCQSEPGRGDVMRLLRVLPNQEHEAVLGPGPLVLRSGETIELEHYRCSPTSSPRADREGRILFVYGGRLLRYDPVARDFEWLAGVGGEQSYRNDDLVTLTATAAVLPGQPEIAIGPNDELLLGGGQVIFEFRDGRLEPYAGFYTSCHLLSGDARMACYYEHLPTGFEGLPALESEFRSIRGMEFGPDGTLYVADYGNQRGQVRAIGPDGILRRVAGAAWNDNSRSRYWDPAYETTPATESDLVALEGITVAPDGRIFLTHSPYHPDGTWGTALITSFYPGDELEWVGGAYTNHNRLSRDPAQTFGIGLDPRSVLRGANHCTVLLIDPRGGLIFNAGFGDHALLRMQPGAPLRAGLREVADPSGTAKLIFDARSRLVELRSLFGDQVVRRFEYDESSRLVGVIEADGPEHTRIERDASGHAVAVIGPYGHRTELSVNGDGLLAELRDPIGRSLRFEYQGDSGLMTAFVDPKGHRSEYEYSPDGRLRVARAPDGREQRLDFETTDEGFAVLHTSPEGRSTRYETITTGDGRRSRRVIEANGRSRSGARVPSGGRSLTASDGTSVTTRLGPPYARDGAGRTVESLEMTLPSGARARLSHEREFFRAEGSDPSTPALGFEHRITLGSGTARVRFDNETRSLSTESPAGRLSTSTYDQDGRLSQVTQAGLHPVQYNYDARGRAVSSTQGDRVTHYEYDTAGNLSAVIDPAGRRTRYEYDALDRPIAEHRAGGEITRYAYDLNSNLSELVPPSRPAHRFERDERARTRRYTAPPLGNTPGETLTRLDGENRVREQVLPSGETVVVTRDTAGRPERVDTPDGAFTYAYDPDSGRLVFAAGPSGVVTQVAYDGPLPVSETTTGELSSAVSYTYAEGSFRPRSETVAGSAPLDLVFDADGLPTQVGPLTLDYDEHGAPRGASLGGVSTVSAHDGYGAVVRAEAFAGSSLVLETVLGYDRLGRITEETDRGSAGDRRREVFYTTNGQVERVVDDGVEVERYTYDPNGNRLSASVRGELSTASYDDRDRLTSYGPWTLQYDAHGRLATRVRSDRGESTGYEYDSRGNLLAVHLPDGRVVSYAANASGQRVLRRVDGALTHGYVYAGDRVVAELAPDGMVRSRFVYGHTGHTPAGMWRGGVWYAFVTDARGSVRAVVHADTGQVVQALDYDSFGVVLSDSSPGFQPFGFAGGLYDPDTGLVRYGARDYVPELGRWTAPDPLGFAAGDTSLYVYAFSDPVNLIDPSGEIAFCPLFMAAMWGYKVASAVMSLLDLMEKSQEFMDPCTSDERRMEMLAEALADMLASLALGKLGQKVGKDLLGMLAKKYGIKACFIAGTLVATVGGAQAIETLAPGDVVLAVDEHTNVVSEQRVLGVSSREVERYLDVRLESPGQAEGAAAEAEHLGVTAEHPFWTSVGWKAAAELVPGDVVLSPHSGWLRVGGSTWVQGPARVWNLEVEEDHTFAVGELAAWVHNGCGSLNQFQKQVERGKTPKSVDRVDKGLGPHEQDHVHFKDGSALNRDGTWKHGGRELTKAESELLQQFGWTIP